MHTSPDRSRSRRLAAGALLILAALAPIGGCNCSATAPVAPITLPPLSAVDVTPAEDTLQVGEQRQFTAVAYDTLGQPVAGAGFVWTSGNTGVFTVSPGGRVIGTGEGAAWLYAEAAGERDSAHVFVYPDSGWIMQTSNTDRNLNAVFFQPDGREGWAVGDGGAIVHTTDAGVTWRTQVGPTTSNLNGVWFADPDTGWAVGNLGTILKTANRGATWTRLTTNFGENLNGVQFANRDTGFIAGTVGAVVRTVDGGRNWTKLNLIGPTFHGIGFANAREGWVVGDNGEIAGTIDAGENWTRVLPSITALSLRGVSRWSRADAWAVGAQGASLRTVDAGGSVEWQGGTLGALNDLHHVHFPSDALVGYAVGFNATGVVLRTEDGGLVWTRQNSNTGRRLKGVHFVDPLRGWAVGDAGTIIHTSLGGR